MLDGGHILKDAYGVFMSLQFRCNALRTYEDSPVHNALKPFKGPMLFVELFEGTKENSTTGVLFVEVSLMCPPGKWQINRSNENKIK